jgi:hypothetical protein
MSLRTTSTTTLVGVGGDVMTFPLSAGVAAAVSLAPRPADLISNASYDTDDDDDDDSDSDSSTASGNQSARYDDHNNGASHNTLHHRHHTHRQNNGSSDGGVAFDGDEGDNDDDSFRELNAARPRSPSSQRSIRSDSPPHPHPLPSHHPPTSPPVTNNNDALSPPAASIGGRSRGVGGGARRRKGRRRRSMDDVPNENKTSVDRRSKSTNKKSHRSAAAPQLIPSTVTPSSPQRPTATTTTTIVTNEEVGVTTITMELPLMMTPISSQSTSTLATSAASSKYALPPRAPSEGKALLSGGLAPSDLMVRPGQVAILDTTEDLFRLSGLTHNRVDVDALLALHSDFVPYARRPENIDNPLSSTTTTTMAATTTTTASTSITGAGVNVRSSTPSLPITPTEIEHPFAPLSSSTAVGIGHPLLSSSSPSPNGSHNTNNTIHTVPSSLAHGSSLSTTHNGMIPSPIQSSIHHDHKEVSASATATIATITVGSGLLVSSSSRPTTSTANTVFTTARSVKNFFSRSRSHSKVAPTAEQVAEQELQLALRRKLTEAAYYVDCAVRGLPTVAEDNNTEANWRASKLHGQTLWLLRLVMAFYMLLPFLQRPSWCLSTPCAHYSNSTSSSLIVVSMVVCSLIPALAYVM